MSNFKPIDDGPLLERDPVIEKARKPGALYFNWWQLRQLTLNVLTYEVLGPGKCMSQEPHRTAEIAETKARDWILLHEEINCSCGFGEHCYLGAYEEGKTP